MGNVEKVKMARYALSMPEEIYFNIRNLANKEGSTAKELINTAIKDFLKLHKEVS